MSGSAGGASWMNRGFFPNMTPSAVQGAQQQAMPQQFGGGGFGSSQAYNPASMGYRPLPQS